MAPWVKTSTTIRGDGSKVIRYESFRNQNAIESRKEAFPHANGIGVWYHTSYFLIKPDGIEHEFNTMKAAKQAAEEEAKNEGTV
jgi:hypothetical protein